MRRSLTLALALAAVFVIASCTPAPPAGTGAEGASATSPAAPGTTSPEATATSTATPSPDTQEASVPSAEEVYASLIQPKAYRSWAKAPGFEQPQRGTGPHGVTVSVFVDEDVERTLAGGPAKEWPVGSVIVKDGFSSTGALAVTAYMRKTNEGWWFAEWGAGGEMIAQGLKVPQCAECHAQGSDSVRSFDLPQ